MSVTKQQQIKCTEWSNTGEPDIMSHILQLHFCTLSKITCLTRELIVVDSL